MSITKFKPTVGNVPMQNHASDAMRRAFACKELDPLPTKATKMRIADAGRSYPLETLLLMGQMLDKVMSADTYNIQANDQERFKLTLLDAVDELPKQFDDQKSQWKEDVLAKYPASSGSTLKPFGYR